MQFHANYNIIESIGSTGTGGGAGSGIVTRNLWSRLEASGSNYNSSTKVWTDSWIYGNDAIVTGSAASISPNAGAYGGYTINFFNNSGSYLSWANKYNTGPITSGGGCTMFIQMELSSSTDSAISFFDTTGGAVTDVSWFGGTSTLGTTSHKIAFPNANDTTGPTVAGNLTIGLEAIQLQQIVYTTGTDWGLNGSKIGVYNQSTPGAPDYVINNNITTSGFNWNSPYTLNFGKELAMGYGWVNGSDGSNYARGFWSNVKRILVYNSVLSENEIRRNWVWMQTQ